MSDKKHKNIAELADDDKSSLSVNKGIQRPNAISETQKQKFLNRKKKIFTTDEYFNKILKGDRVMLARAITLAESRRQSDNDLSKEIINKVIPYSGNSIRVGITGVPGAGKSTFIEALGLYLLTLGKKVAVMAVDPSSSITGGSLLGDKTRMEILAGKEDVFIRPSSSAGYLGGVNRATRESIILCEAAGYDIILIETVGVGQSEVMVHSMVDFFLLLNISGAGDELQGIKKGIMEMADAITITKADGDNEQRAEVAKQERQNALHYSARFNPDWPIPVTTCSSLTGKGVKELWKTIESFIVIMKKNNQFYERRRTQMKMWLDTTIKQMLEQQFYNDNIIIQNFETFQSKVFNSKMTPINAAEALIDLFREK